MWSSCLDIEDGLSADNMQKNKQNMNRIIWNGFKNPSFFTALNLHMLFGY